MPFSRRQLIKLGALGALSVTGVAQLLGERAVPAELLEAPLRDASISWGDALWRRWAIGLLWREWQQAGTTPIIKLATPFNPGIRLLLKNEAASVTGSLKHRVAWSLLMWGLIGGKITPRVHLYERTSGNTGIAEAYFANKLGLPFTAVTAASISPLKLEAIRRYGGRTQTPPPDQTVAEFFQQVLKADAASYDIGQFANTEKAIAYFQGTPALSENLLNELLSQLKAQGERQPDWFIAGAGSGGTATSLGRYWRKWAPLTQPAKNPRLLVVDPEYSVLFDWYLSGDSSLRIDKASRIEGVGSSGPIRFGETFSLQREVVDRMMKIPDALTMAGMHLLSSLVGFRVGPSSGLNFIGTLRLACELQATQHDGALASIICDSGDRYADTYYNPSWVAEKGLQWQHLAKALQRAWQTGTWPSQLELS